MNTQRTARRRATGTIAVLLCISLAAAACSDDTNNASGRTRNAALVGLINGTFTADQGGWVGAGFPLGTWGQCAGGLPSLGDPANALSFGTSGATITQSVTIPSPSTVTLSASGRVGGNVANSYTFSLADTNEARSTGALTGMSYTSPTASTLSVTTTAANENVTITIAAVTATSSQTGCIGPVISDASLAIAVTPPATTTTTTIAPVIASTTTTTLAPVVRAECVAPTPCIVGSVDSKGRTVIFYGPAHLIFGSSAYDQYQNDATIAVQMAPNNWNASTVGDPIINWGEAGRWAAAYGAAGEVWHLPYWTEAASMCAIASTAPSGCFTDDQHLKPGFGDIYWSGEYNQAAGTARAILFTGTNGCTTTCSQYNTAGLFSFVDASKAAVTAAGGVFSQLNWFVNSAVPLSVRPVREVTIVPVPPPPAPTVPAPVVVAATVYKVGDIGPSGTGIVFYADPNAPAGSRYLEACRPGCFLTDGDYGIVHTFSGIFRWSGIDPWYTWAGAVNRQGAIPGGGRYGDWVLPTTVQLRIMYNAAGTPGDLHLDSQCEDYWSSEHASASLGGVALAYAYAVGSAITFLTPDTNILCIRMIRKF